MKVLGSVTVPMLRPALLNSATLIFTLSIAALGVPLLLGTANNIKFVSSYLYDLLDERGGAGSRLGERRRDDAPARRDDAARDAELADRRRGALRLHRRRVEPHGAAAVCACGAGRSQSCSASTCSSRTIDPGARPRAHVVRRRADAARRAVAPRDMGALAPTDGGRLPALRSSTASRSRSSARSSPPRSSRSRRSSRIAPASGCGASLPFLMLYPRATPGADHRDRLLLDVTSSPARSATGFRNSIWGIMLAFCIRNLPFAYVVMYPTLARIGEELDRAGRASGAGWWRTSRSIVLPLLRPAIFASFVLMFVEILNDYDPARLPRQAGNRGDGRDDAHAVHPGHDRAGGRTRDGAGRDHGGVLAIGAKVFKIGMTGVHDA